MGTDEEVRQHLVLAPATTAVLGKRLGRFAEGIPSCQRAIRISPRDSRVGIWWG